MRSAEELRTRDKILLHLLRNEILSEKKIVPVTITQSGIQEEIGIARSVTSRRLQRLEEEGLVRREKKIIQSKDSRLLAYFLTEDGKSRALLIKNSLEESPVDKKLLELSSKKRKMKPKDLLAEYKTALELIEKEKTGQERNRLKLNILSEIVKLHLELRDIGQAMNTSLKLLRMSLDTGDNLGEAQGHLYIGIVQEIKNEWQNAEGNFLKAYALSDGLDDLLTAEAVRHLGRVYWRIGEFDKAVFYYEKCLNRLKGTRNNRNSLASIYTDLGNVYGDMGDMNKAIEYYDKSLELSTKTKNRHESIRAQHNIGYAYQTMEEYDKAMEHYEKCLKLAVESDSAEDIGHAYINVGYCYAKINKIKKALECTKMGLQIFKLSNDLNMIAGGYANHGIIQGVKKNWKKAEEYFEKALAIYEKLNSPYHLAWAYFEFGILLKSKKDKRGKTYLEKSLRIFQGLNSVKDIEKVKRALKKKVK